MPLQNTSTAIISTTYILYEPEFDINAGEWKDKNPFKKNSRDNYTIECRCVCGSSFNTHSGFSNHCKNKTHKKWVQHYDRLYAEGDKAKKELNEFKKEKEFSDRRNKQLQRENRELQQQNQTLQKINSNKDIKIYKLQQQIDELKKSQNQTISQNSLSESNISDDEQPFYDTIKE
tara:strand:- start:169 stop:693 length:525 start_codon:yes stop_codon:yes gene_type:complete